MQTAESKLVECIVTKNTVDAKDLFEEIMLDRVRDIVEVTRFEVLEKHFNMNEKKMDPVGQEDDDVDNDGDSDESDEYLKNRREKIAKSMKKDDQ
jgi:hypothetical protein